MVEGESELPTVRDTTAERKTRGYMRFVRVCYPADIRQGESNLNRLRFFFPLIEKLNSGWSGGPAEVNFAKRYPELTLANISAVLDLVPTVTYNNNALPMRRIGQR